jgi:hypothetical protein
VNAEGEVETPVPSGGGPIEAPAAGTLLYTF